MPHTGKRAYQSPVRRRRARETRRRIVDAARRLLQRDGYAGMTVESISRQARVSVQTIYAAFGSKTGILTELLNEAAFGTDYEDAVREAMEADVPESRLQGVARIARQIHDAQAAAFDLLRGAGVVAPELARLEQEREALRYERQEQMIAALIAAKSLRPELNRGTARDILWTLTGGDVYRMLVRERGWSSARYQRWLAETLILTLLRPSRPEP